MCIRDSSYVVLDEKVCVFDTVDQHFTHEWLDNVGSALNGRKPDYLIVQHMEPDHSANIDNFVKTYPDVTVVGNAKTFAMMEQFFGCAYENRLVVKDGDTLTTGRHTFTFVFAPMVHWPEVMVTYDLSLIHILRHRRQRQALSRRDAGREEL